MKSDDIIEMLGGAGLEAIKRHIQQKTKINLPPEEQVAILNKFLLSVKEQCPFKEGDIIEQDCRFAYKFPAEGSYAIVIKVNEETINEGADISSAMNMANMIIGVLVNDEDENVKIFPVNWRYFQKADI